MAFIDQGQVVVRVVYDGPALAGKTSSLTALGRSLGREVHSGDESGGRTLFFDWMDYVGGLFEGRPIRCQVVTVPGQEQFWHRRRAILESADVIVFVADSDANRLGADLRAFERLTGLLREITPKPAMILQANKRDLKTAVPLLDIRTRLATGELVAVTESIASEGVGIRETFVLAVRLALDRVRELRRLGQLPSGPPEIDGPAELMTSLQALDLDEPPAEPPPRTELVDTETPSPLEPHEPPAEEPRSEAAAADRATPRPPTPLVPGGMIWPPTGGRIILHESQPDMARVSQLAAGGWADLGNPLWLIHSPKGYSFGELDDGRAELIAWARWHVDLGDRISSRRCVVLGEVSRQGQWQLWQIVGRMKSFRELLEEAVGAVPPERLGRLLLTAAETLVDVAGDPQMHRLRPTIDSLGLEGGRPVFIGLLPTAPRDAEGTADDIGSPPDLGELNLLFADCLRAWPGDPMPLLDWIDRRLPRTPALEETWRVIEAVRDEVTAG